MEILVSLSQNNMDGNISVTITEESGWKYECHSHRKVWMEISVSLSQKSLHGNISVTVTE